MAEPTSTAAGGALLVKLIGVPVITAAIATSLGFIFMWPASKKEAFIRFVVTLTSSFFLGPLLVIATKNWAPGMFSASREVAIELGIEPAFSILFLAGPLLVLAGLPAWYLIGALFRWLDNRKTEDLGGLIAGATNVFRTTTTRVVSSVTTSKSESNPAEAMPPMPEVAPGQVGK